MTPGILDDLGRGGKREGAGAPRKERPRVAVAARISADAYEKLLRLMERFGGLEKRGALTDALEKAILDAPEHDG